jgi:hypothetical protein
MEDEQDKKIISAAAELFATLVRVMPPPMASNVTQAFIELAFTSKPLNESDK